VPWTQGRPQNRDALRFAGFAPLGFVLKALVVEKQLLARGKDELGAAVNALEDSVLEFHSESSFGQRQRAQPYGGLACAIAGYCPLFELLPLGSALPARRSVRGDTCEKALSGDDRAPLVGACD
jgi:hypothetical protein